ncbi:MAG: subfamily polymerase sigma-24 factor [Bradyrhizobium sp.]|nr:subfamily polymerase sigma-24 factor [Bradyrhizobium sp.]
MATEEAKSDQRAVAALSARYGSAVIAFFTRRLRDRVEAEDMTQEVFASLSRRAELHTIEDPERYIFQVAANHLRDRARRLARRPTIDSEGFADPMERLIDEMSPERLLLARETYALFVAALQALPERPRTMFILNRFEEMPGREIAALLGVSQRLVEKEISRAIAMLRKKLP